MTLATQPDLSRRLTGEQRRLRTRLSRQDVLIELLRGTHSSLEPRRVADFLVSWVPAWIPVPGWAVLSGDTAAGNVLLAARGIPADVLTTARLVGDWVLAAGTDFLAADLSRDARLSQAPSLAVMAFPLSARGRTVAALVGIDDRPAAGTPRLGEAALTAWRVLLEAAAMALDNALALERAEALSVTDDLTRLYNSRYLNEALRRETKRASRNNKPLSLLFIDLDGFKAVNDTHGHLHGSRALIEAAAVIRGSARETDVVARFGGDEFAVVLPETGPEGAWAVALRVRERIAEHRFLAAEGLDVRLTASVGIASLPDAAASAEDLVHAADLAMYRVKMSGKNGIHTATA